MILDSFHTSLHRPKPGGGLLPVRSGISSLCNILCGQASAGSLEETELKRVLDLAEEEHVLASVAHFCLGLPDVAAQERERLKALQREAAFAALYWTSELRQILETFAAARLKVVPLKGPFLAERLYGDAALRTSHDLDLLVPAHEVAAAEAALSKMGFRAGSADDYHRPWYKGATTVELHHDVENPLAFDFDTPRVLERARPATFLGQPCWQFAPEDELLYLCLHGVRHRFERLSLIVDLCHAFRSLRPPVLSVDLYQDREQRGLLLLGLEMARRLDPSIDPLIPLHSFGAHEAHLKRLAGRLWNELLTRRSQPLDWRTLHQFYIEMELPEDRLNRRLRHMRILSGRLIEADHIFAARLGLRRTWHARLLRPVRLVLSAMGQTA